MTTIIIFISAVVLLAFLALSRVFALASGRGNMIVDFVAKGDKYILLLKRRLHENKHHLTIPGLSRLTIKVAEKTKKKMVSVKRRFDHQQSHFFVKRDQHLHQPKGSASFFLKHISEHKKTIQGQGEIENS
ncbi:MAG: hypothetical protein WCO10_00775 [bacterium]